MEEGGSTIIFHDADSYVSAIRDPVGKRSTESSYQGSGRPYQRGRRLDATKGVASRIKMCMCVEIYESIHTLSCIYINISRGVF